jgi:hypothetical protein
MLAWDAYRPEIVDRDGQLKPDYSRRFRRLGAFHPDATEAAESLAMKVTSMRTGRPMPIPVLYGFVDTDLGPATVVERMSQADGQFAPTISRLIGTGEFSETHRRTLQAFFDEAIVMNLCLHPAKVAYAVARDGESRFVAIDRLGERTFLKIRESFPAINAYGMRKKQKKLMARIEERIAGFTAAPLSRDSSQ